jgi:hypothetical protein
MAILDRNERYRHCSLCVAIVITIGYLFSFGTHYEDAIFVALGLKQEEGLVFVDKSGYLKPC